MVFDSERRQGKLISTVAIDKHMIFRAAGFNAIEIDPISNFRGRRALNDARRAIMTALPTYADGEPEIRGCSVRILPTAHAFGSLFPVHHVSSFQMTQAVLFYLQGHFQRRNGEVKWSRC